MDVLGLEDRPYGDQSIVYEGFLEQPQAEGWYETSLLWKGEKRIKSNAGKLSFRQRSAIA